MKAIDSTRYLSAKPALKKPASAVQSRPWPPFSQRAISPPLSALYVPGAASQMLGEAGKLLPG